MRKTLYNIAIICLCIFAVFLTGVLGLLWYSGAFVLDRSAVVHIEGLEWNGKSYHQTGGEYTEGRTIAKSQDGSWDINEIKEDPSHNFVVARTFLDQFLYVADDYNIPKSGEITKAAWSYNYIPDEEFLNTLEEINANKTASFEYETEAIFIHNEQQQMKKLRIAYENCPVATIYIGYMGKVDGKWVITTQIIQNESNSTAEFAGYTVSCYEIPEKYHGLLEKISNKHMVII